MPALNRKPSLLLGPKSLRFLAAAVQEKIEDLQQAMADPARSDDQRSDDGNDLALYRSLQAQLTAAELSPAVQLGAYECWVDDQCTSLTPLEYMDREREQGRLSPEARHRYTIHAATYEEAMAIHNFRRGFAPYVPTGEPAPCATCGEFVFAQGSGQCWQCGAVTGPSGQESAKPMCDDVLTMEEAYRAMFHFLEAHYARTQADGLGSLLGDLSWHSVREGQPADPAAWLDWTNAIDRARASDDRLSARLTAKPI